MYRVLYYYDNDFDNSVDYQSYDFEDFTSCLVDVSQSLFALSMKNNNLIKRIEVFYIE